MEDIFFENRFLGNYKMVVEVSRKYSVGPRPPVAFVMALIYIGFVVKCWYEGILPYMILSLLFVGAVFTAIYFLPHFYTWLLLHNTKKQNDGVQPEVVVSFGDAIEVREGMVHLTIEYRKIKKVVRLRHSYLLMNSRRGGIMIDPEKFTKGTFEEFKQFLREKRPDLVIPE